MAVATLSGKTCVITGATSGIGKATALSLAGMGASLLLVARNRAKADSVAGEIRDKTGVEVQIFIADLGVQAEIRRVAGEILATGCPIHLLVNNAGVVNLQRHLTVDGIEEVFAVNHLGYFLFTLLLLDRIKGSAPAQIVNVASEAHKFSGINFDDLGGERAYKSMRIYGQSKLANIMFTYELARRLAGTGVTVNCLHPGAVSTGLGVNNGRMARALIGFLQLFFKAPEQGAATSIYLAASPAVEGVNGKYFDKCRARKSSKASYDEAAQRRLWDLSIQMVGLAPHS
jgi:NAD(P)-dependent dehydrogenase (short-subunit alcohol dehydrogenase family)